MKKADLHLHTSYSDHPSEWFLQRLGTAESYTTPEEAFKKAKQAGMDFVAITDHNKIEGAITLKNKFPDEVIVGCESTAYFPEDNCKIHILIYGLNQSQYEIIEKLRTNIYLLRDYLKSEELPHSVAHTAYSVNNRLTTDHLEKLILLFDTFEGINGARDAFTNNALTHILSNLTRENIDALYKKHKIEPFSESPEIKNFTAGSDDHAAIFIGKTFTASEANTSDEFIKNILNKRTFVKGRHNNYHSFVFTLYKIAYEFSKQKSSDLSRSFLNQLAALIFNHDSLSLKDKAKFMHFAKKNIKDKNPINRMFADLINTLNSNSHTSIDSRFDIIYSHISSISDEFLKQFFVSLENDIRNSNIGGIVKSISSALPGIFLSLPFFTSLNHFNMNKHLLTGLSDNLNIATGRKSKKILWFTDTLTDLNGVSVTLRNIGWQAHSSGNDIMIAACVKPDTESTEIPPNVIELESIFDFAVPAYETITMQIPSILQSLRKIYEYEPDEIYISTPGPVGLLGLLASKVLNIPSVGVYHTDFTLQTHELINDESVETAIETAINWFYSSMTRIKVPSNEYISILKTRGLDENKMTVFQRGIHSDYYYPRKDAKTFISKHFDIKDGITLLYAGRVSKDKNLDFLIDVYSELLKEKNDINLIITGDGPYLKELKSKYQHFSRIVFTGRQKQSIMPALYSSADIFMFPSITDTFGMVILESQSCELPAIVSDKGGPQEIIIENETGLIANSNSLSDWVSKTKYMMNLISSNYYKYKEMCETARVNVLMNYTWKTLLDTMTENKEHKRKLRILNA